MLSIKQLSGVIFISIAIGGGSACQHKSVQKQADVHAVLWGQSFISEGVDVIGFDINKQLKGATINVSDKIGEITQDNNNLWLSAPVGKNERYGKNIYLYNYKENKLKKVAVTKGLSPHKIFILGNLALVSMYISDSEVRPFNSSIEAYNIENNHTLSFIKSIYLDTGHRFKGDLIAVSPSKEYIYIASRDLYNKKTGAAPILYVINARTLKVESKTNLVAYFGSPGGIAVSKKHIYISALKKHPGSPGTNEEIERIKDNRVFIFDRKTVTLIDEIQTSYYFPEQLIYNAEKDHLYALHNFRSNMAISIIDCNLNKEVNVIDGIDRLSDMSLVNADTLFVTAKYNGEKGLLSLNLKTNNISTFFSGNYGAISYKNGL